jgi:hypothetical protein
MIHNYHILNKNWETYYNDIFGIICFYSNNTVRSKIKKIEKAVINTLPLATRKTLIQMSLQR